MPMDNHLGPIPEPDEVPAVEEKMILTQCRCDNCTNTFFVSGLSMEFIPTFCCYCGREFEAGTWDEEDVEDEFHDEDFLWM